jgi:peptidyl-prolyl cis-trans isomerase D
MPIMTRMRESMPIILFGLLIAFLITIIFEWGMDYLGIRGGRQDIVGSVDGKKISYKEFSELLKTFSDNQKAQTGKEPDEDQLKQLRDQVWQTLVTQQLVDEQIKRLGLTVTDQELVDWVRGDNPPEDLRRNFVDSTGQFRKDLYEEFLSNPNQFIRDPEGREQDYGTRWLADYEKSLRQRRLQEKLQSIILAAVRVPEGEVLQRFMDQNIRYDADYALFDAASLVPDSAIQVTDADLRAYYNDNTDQFKVDATRTLKYVLFPVKATAADSAARWKDMEEATARARKGENFQDLVNMYSDRPDTGAFFNPGELSAILEDALTHAKVGDVVGPIQDADGLHLLKVLGEKKAVNEYIRASHILFTVAGPDSNATKAEAQMVAKRAREGNDFAQLAKEYSKDPSGARGGDLGWFTKGRMVPAFENAAFKARVGEIVGPIRTQFGLHIIKVTGRDSRALKVAQVFMKIDPSSQTRNDLSDRAKDFAYNAGQSEFTKEAQQTGLEVKETQIQEKGGLIPGLGVNEAATRWAFKNNTGSVSDPYTIGNAYVVFFIADAKDAGVRPFDEVKQSIRPATLRKLKIDKTMQMAAAVRSKLAPSDSLSKIEQIDPAVKVQNTGAFTLAGAVPGIGRDPEFVGAVSGLQTGQISPPVRGMRGAFLIQLLSKTAFDSAAFASQKDMLISRLTQEKRQQVMTDWLARLKEKADIVDNRDLFFRD